MLWTPSGNIVNDGLVLYLDAGIKGSYPGSGTTWTDLAGTNNGTLTNGPTYSSANGGSIVFDGTNDYVALSTSLNVSLGVTVEIWYKRNGNGTDIGLDTVVSKWWDGSVRGFNFQVTATEYLFIFRPNGQVADTTLSVTDATLTNNWTHLIVTNNGSVGKLYKNGTETLSSSVPGHVRNNTAQLRLARYTHTSLNGYANGSLAITRIYSRALSAAEINQNFQVTRKRFGV